ncbi:MAG: ankyrin repeat domain-containing protein [Burkholderiales bacterium]
MKNIVFVCFILFSLLAQAGSFDDMFIAVKNDDSGTVQELLAKGFDPNASDEEGDTLLMLAAREGNPAVSQKLIAAGADLNRQNSLGETALMLAAYKGHLAVAQLLLDKGASLRGARWNALLYAILGKNDDIVHLLMAHGADANARLENGTTALMLAAKGGSVEVVQDLLKHHAQVDARNDEQKTAYDWAMAAGNTDIADILVLASARKARLLRAVAAGEINAVRDILKKGVSPNETDVDGETPLNLAIHARHADIVSLLLSAGANPRQADAEGDTPLMAAAFTGDTSILQRLLDEGVPIDSPGVNALMYAAANGQNGALSLLLARGAKVNAQTEDGTTALMLAARNGNLEAVKILLENHADVHLRSKNNKTARAWAISAGNSEIAEFLAEKELGGLVREWFAWFDRKDDVALFLKHFADSELDIELPGQTIHSQSEFSAWYQKIRELIDYQHNDLLNVHIQKAAGETYGIDIGLKWNAVSYQKEILERYAKQHWDVEANPEGVWKIHKMVVTYTEPSP